MKPKRKTRQTRTSTRVTPRARYVRLTAQHVSPQSFSVWCFLQVSRSKRNENSRKEEKCIKIPRTVYQGRYSAGTFKRLTSCHDKPIHGRAVWRTHSIRQTPAAHTCRLTAIAQRRCDSLLPNRSIESDCSGHFISKNIRDGSLQFSLEMSAVKKRNNLPQGGSPNQLRIAPLLVE